MTGFDYQTDRNKRVEELDRIKEQLVEHYSALTIKQYSDAEKRWADWKKKCERLDSRMLHMTKMNLPFTQHADFNSQSLALCLKVACLTTSTIDPKEHVSADEVFEALIEVLGWEPNSDSLHFLTIDPKEFNKRYSYRPARTRAILVSVRKNLTGFLGEFCEHRKHVNDFEDFYKLYRAGTASGTGVFDFMKDDKPVEVKTKNEEAKITIFYEKALQGGKKDVLLSQVHYESGRAVWEGGIVSDTDTLQQNPTFDDFKLDKSGQTKAVEHIGIRPWPGNDKPNPRFPDYYGIQPYRNKDIEVGR